MTRKMISTDPDIRGSLPALRRAARRARRLAAQTGTACYVIQDGRIVDLNRGRKRPSSRRSRRA